MPAELKPGTAITLRVTKNPTNEAAAKTLSRLFAKDPVNKRARIRRKKLRAGALDVRRRGGRPWEVRTKAPRLIQPKAGDSCKIRATSDVVGDLQKLARFVEVVVGK
jgi:hypothetical protein